MVDPVHHLIAFTATKGHATPSRVIITAITTMPILAIGTQHLGSGTKKRAVGSTMTIIHQVRSVDATPIGKTHRASAVAQVHHPITIAAADRF
jgi:hypothetical protein